jgi:hypothetical protein
VFRTGSQCERRQQCVPSNFAVLKGESNWLQAGVPTLGIPGSHAR